MTTFADIGVRPHALAALERHGITSPLAVQASALPALLAGRDAVIQAPTGSGKTLAFVLPLIERLGARTPGGPRALIVVPTRELARQITDVITAFGGGLRSALLIGGVGHGSQLAALRRGADVVVGCPGRILDHADRGAMSLAGIRYLVLDEADEMLDQGFARDVERIIGLMPGGRDPGRRQTVLASATLPDWVQRLIDRHLVDPDRVEEGEGAASALEHGLVHVGREDRIDVLSRLLRASQGSAIVFHRTKHGAKRLSRDLSQRGHRAGELQGNLAQNARDRAVADFRELRTDVLVATNVAARGLDIAHVQLVINYELPESAQWLTHRIGRTARNGAQGRALTFLADEDMEQWRRLRRGGAPELPWVDVSVLLGSGSMAPVDAPASARQHRSAPLRAQPTARRRRWGVASTRPGGRREGSRQAHAPRPTGTASDQVSSPGARQSGEGRDITPDQRRRRDSHHPAAGRRRRGRTAALSPRT